METRCDIDKMETYYFAYGSNLKREQMIDRCPDSVPVERAILNDYELTFDKVADIRPKMKSKVFGAIYKVTSMDLNKLDIYEGYPHKYAKNTVVVQGETKNYLCIVYNLVDSKYQDKPTHIYLNRIKTGYKNWNLPNKRLLFIAQNVNPTPYINRYRSKNIIRNQYMGDDEHEAFLSRSSRFTKT